MRIVGFVWGASLAAGMLAATGAGAAVVVSSLPTYDTSDWTRGAMNPGNSGMTPEGEAVLETNPYAGNWFGWGIWYANTPSWSMGSASSGNYLSLTARFGPDRYGFAAKDWNTYFYDGGYEASINYNPTTSNCDPNAIACYAATALQGVDLYFGDSGPSGYRTQFVELDISVDNTYEILMKDGLVSYRINGHAYTGDAYAVSIGAQLLVIGDGSGTTPTGQGTMVLSAISLDNAPTESLLTSNVPEPASWATMAGGFGLLGAALRRRRRTAVAA